MNNSGNPYGLNASDTVVDPHMMKNGEWGAVAYLSKNATYGKGEEVWINPNSNFITGQAGSSVSASSTTSTDAYNTGNGSQVSTTGNATGVYDMSGGAYEYVAAYVNNGHSNLSAYGNSLVNETDTKYKDTYRASATNGNDNQQTNYNYAQPTETSGHYGDATWETSSNYTGSTSWCGDYSYFPYTSDLFFLRGGYYSATSIAGVFNFSCSNGGANSNCTFRLVLPAL